MLPNQERRNGSHIPVVLLTARVDQASSVEGYKSGADIYLAKPFDIDSLLVILRNILRQARPTSCALS